MNNSTSIVSVNTDINNSKNYGKTEVSEKLVTTKELAELLGVDVSTVKKTVKRLEEGGDVLHHLTTDKYNNTVFIFTEEQATLIKQEIQKHHNLSNRQIDTVSTEAEVLANFTKAAYDMKLLYESKIAQLKNENMAMKPKVEFFDKVTGSADTHDMKEVAKLLNFKNIGRNTLFEILRDEGILDKNNQPYQKYVDAGYFRIIETKWEDRDGDTHINLKTVVFQKGVDFIRKTVIKNPAYLNNAIESAADKWISSETRK